jgi:hypothetical protein
LQNHDHESGKEKLNNPDRLKAGKRGGWESGIILNEIGHSSTRTIKLKAQSRKNYRGDCRERGEKI